ALQGHVGYLPLVVPLCGVAVLAPFGRWWLGRRGAIDPEAGDASPFPRLVPLGLAAVALALLWSGPLWDLVSNDPNNVSKLLANFTSPSEDPIGLSAGIHDVFQAANPVGSWV